MRVPSGAVTARGGGPPGRGEVTPPSRRHETPVVDDARTPRTDAVRGVLARRYRAQKRPYPLTPEKIERYWTVVPGFGESIIIPLPT